VSWNYTSTAPLSCSRSFVRLKLGDTTSGDQLIQDEEIDAMLSNYSNATRAAAECAFAIAGKFARRADKSAGRLRIAGSQSADAYERLGKRLLVQVGLEAAPYAGGISISDKQTDESDTDRVAPSFTRGMHDFPNADVAGSSSA